MAGGHLKQGKRCHLGRLSLEPPTLSVVSEKDSTPSNENKDSKRNFVLSRSSTGMSLLNSHLKRASLDDTIVSSVNHTKYMHDKRGNGSSKSILKRSYTSESLGKQPVSDFRNRNGDTASEGVELPRLNTSNSAFRKLPENMENGNKTGRMVLRRASTCENFVNNKTSLTGLAKDFENTFNQKRMSFHCLGNKVTRMIRAKNAFSRTSKASTIDKTNLDVTDEEMFVIKVMPQQPRFASMLSVEAQYAILKGYEDIVFDKLSLSYPECRWSLRRSKTPIANIEVRKDVRRKSELITEESDSEKQTSESKDLLTDEPPKGDKASPVIHAAPESTTPLPVADVNVTSKPTRKSKSMSDICPEDRQLVMTYRYQSVMDMLDNLRLRDGLNTLSPRLKARVSGKTPVNEFNSWSAVWEREFKTKDIKTTLNGK